jgi:hypothetical protein
MNRRVSEKPLYGNILRRFAGICHADACAAESGFVNHAPVVFRIGLSQGVFTGRHCGVPT